MTKQRMVWAAAAVAVVLVGLTATAVRAGVVTLHTDTVAPYSVDTYTQGFAGDQQAAVVVTGDGSTRLGLMVYDENGNLIGSDEGRNCVVTWTPRWSGAFRIKVVNLGPFSNNYVLGTK